MNILITAFLVFSLSGCTTLRLMFGGVKKPQVELHEAAVTGLNFAELSLGLKFSVQNSNAFDLVLRNLRYHAYLFDIKITEDTLSNDLIAKAKQETILEIPVRIKLVQLGQIAEKLLRKGLEGAILKLHGDAFFVVDGHEIKVSFSEEKALSQL